MNHKIKSLNDRVESGHYKHGMWVGVRNQQGSHISFKLKNHNDMGKLAQLISTFEVEA